MAPASSTLERDLIKLAESQGEQFVELARATGLDPKRDFIGADLTFCNFENQDLREFNFTDADLRYCRFYRTVLLGDHIRGTQFSSRKGFLVTSVTSGHIAKDDIPLSSLTYTDAIATVIKRLSELETIEEKTQYLEGVVALDPRQSLQRFARTAFSERGRLQQSSIAIPSLMGSAISSIYPLARGKLIDSYIRILGENRHARHYLAEYYRNRARGPEVHRMLSAYLAD
ncbi:MAG: pentapeptide repeat-containing protein [Hyphomicrobiales bacterium]